MRAVAIVGWISIAGAAHAQTQALDIDQICPVDRSGIPRFSPAALMMAALDLNPPSRRTLDLDGDNTETEDERLQVVLENPCSEHGSGCAADRGKIVKVQSTLLSIFARTDLTITRRRAPPTPDEVRREPWLAARPEAGAAGSVAELLDPRERFLAVACHGPANPAGRPVATAEIEPPARPKPVFRVTSKLEELTREDGQKLKTVDAAALSISKDNAGDKLTFGIDAIVGVSVPLGGRPDAIIPFVQYQRTSVRDSSSSPAKTTRSPDKLGLGAVVGLHVARYDDVNIAPIYVIDYERSSRVFSVKANWIPGFLRQIDAIPVMRSRPLVPGLLFYGIAPRILAQASHVLDAGTNAGLMDTSNYARIGGDITLDLWGDGGLKALTGSVAYKRLFRLGAGPEGAHLLKTNIQYWLDPDQHVSIGYTYQYGLDEDTSTRVNDWQVSLGLRF